MQFMGCVIGDFTKSAINTAIFTGKLIGACSMLYGYVTTNVPSYANYARTFGQITELNPKSWRSPRSVPSNGGASSNRIGIASCCRTPTSLSPAIAN